MNTPPLREELLEQFEHAWQSGEPPDLARFWAARRDAVSESDRLAWLLELIRVDLEYRWSRAGGERGWLEDYAARLPEVGPQASWPLDLIAEEWRARWRWGDRPEVGEFRRRFTERDEALSTELRRIQHEMLREWPAQRPPAKVKPPVAAVVPGGDPRAPLDYRDFVLQELIGSGGMGKVYRTRQKSCDRTFAVKMLRKARWTSPGAVERFLEEGRVVSRLRHPGIVAVHGLGRTPGGGPFIVMDFIAGANLGEVMAHGRPSPRQAVAWVGEAAAALDYAHRQGVVHCDFKPSNLLLEDTGRILLSDFGLATSLPAPTGCWQWGGTPGYMAPEQLDPVFGAIGPATDVFALGLVLHTLLVGQEVFRGKHVLELLTGWPHDDRTCRGILSGEDIPTALAGVLEACLAIDPAARIPSASALAEVLRDAASALPDSTSEERPVQ